MVDLHPPATPATLNCTEYCIAPSFDEYKFLLKSCFPFRVYTCNCYFHISMWVNWHLVCSKVHTWKFCSYNFCVYACGWKNWDNLHHAKLSCCTLVVHGMFLITKMKKQRTPKRKNRKKHQHNHGKHRVKKENCLSVKINVTLSQLNVYGLRDSL